jgi:hypothetical protein
MSRFVDSIIAYRILRLLVIPFTETDAYRLGIIDAKGKELKRMAQLNTVAERDAYTVLHRMVFRLKKIIEKVPIENKKLVSFAAALSLIKEHYRSKKEPLDLETQYLNKFNTDLNEEINFIQTYNSRTLTFKQFAEEVPANNAGTPGVAGFTPDTVGVSAAASKKYKQQNKLFRRSDVANVNSNSKIT